MIPKPQKIVSKKIRRSAQGESCTLRYPGCKGSEGVVFCHINSRWKGVGNKSPDLFGVYGCWHCHSKLDEGRIPASEQLRALQETQMRLYSKNLININ